MKKAYLTLIAIFLIFQFSYAQSQWSSGTNNSISNTNTGFVGIGTTTPASALDVNGAIAVKGIVINDSQSISVPSAGTYVVASGNRIKGIYTLSFEAPSRAQTVELTVNANQYDYNSSVTVLSNNSYAGSVVMSNFRLLFSSDNSTVYLVFDIANGNGGTSVAAHFDGTGYYTPNWGGTIPASPITQTVYPLVINMGNVSIGTNNANGYKLAVNGSAIATSMTVKPYANWPDYVFKNDYTLPSLADVKTYIDQNQHLPGVPSAQELEKDGLNLGEMNTVLMKKVEELTLYLIEKGAKEKQQETILNKQQEILKAQQAQIDLLIKQVAELSNQKTK